MGFFSLLRKNLNESTSADAGMLGREHSCSAVSMGVVVMFLSACPFFIRMRCTQHVGLSWGEKKAKRRTHGCSWCVESSARAKQGCVHTTHRALDAAISLQAGNFCLHVSELLTQTQMHGHLFSMEGNEETVNEGLHPPGQP